MTKKNIERNKHSFSIEMGSRGNLSHVSLTDDSEGVLLKGKLGKIVEITYPEGLMIEIEEDIGVLRLDLNEKDIEIMSKKGMLSK